MCLLLVLSMLILNIQMLMKDFIFKVIVIYVF